MPAILPTQIHMEDELSSELLALLLSDSSDGIFVSNQRGQLVEANPWACTMLGCLRPELLGASLTDFIIMDEPAAGSAPGDAEARGASLRCKGGALLSVKVRIRELPGGHLLHMVHDPSRCTWAQELRSSEEKYRYLFESNPYPMWIFDLGTRAFLAANDAAIEKYGYSREEFLQMRVDDLHPDQDRPRLAEHFARPRGRLLESRGWNHCLKDGSRIVVDVISHKIQLDGNDCSLVIAQDVTEKKRAEARVQYITRLYATLSQVSRTIVRVKDKAQLFQSICDVAVQYGQFRMAWLGLVDEGQKVRFVARAGHHDGYLDSLEINLAGGPGLQGPAFRAIQAGKPAFTDDIESDPYFRPWLEQALARGYRSYAAVPLRQGERVTGLLGLYASELGFFNEEELSLLEEIGEQISFALDALELENSRRELEAERMRLLNAIDRSLNEIYMFDPETLRFEYANQGALQNLGYTAAELRGMTPLDLKPDFTEASFRQLLEPLLGGQKEALVLETMHRRADGSLYPVQVHMQRIEQDGRSMFLAVILDISERRAAEARLRASEENYRSLFNNVPDGVYRTTLEGAFLAANPTLVKMLGYDSFEELQQHNVRDIYEQAGDRDSFVDTLLGKREGHNLEVHLKRKDGSQLTGLDNSRAILDEHDRVLYFEGTLTDITEQKLSEHRVRQQLQRITILRDIDRAITTGLDLRLVMRQILGQVADQLAVDACAVLTFDAVSNRLNYLAWLGLPEGSLPRAGIRLGRGLAGKVAMDRQATHFSNLRGIVEMIPEAQAMITAGFTAYHGFPLISKGQLKGILEVFLRSPVEAGPDWLQFLETLAGQASVAIDSFEMFDGLNRSNLELAQAYDATIEGWSRAMDMRDHETLDHTQRVTDMTMELAMAFGLSSRELTNIRWGALLHDIGKIGVPDAVLRKPGPLTPEEWVMMRRHPVLAHEMLSPIEYLRGAMDIPLYHHEKWDGSGYPEGLKGPLIPLPARLFAIVDIWDGIRSDRPYRPAWPEQEALDYIRSLSGSHLDPQVVHKFFEARIFDLRRTEP